jgi:hypothetical protein
MKFIKLTDNYGYPIYFLASKIYKVDICMDGNNPVVTCVHYVIGNYSNFSYVKESPEEILEKIKEAESEIPKR